MLANKMTAFDRTIGPLEVILAKRYLGVVGIHNTIRNVCFTSILLKNPLLWRPHLGFVALSARQIRGSSPYVAKIGPGRE